MLHTYLARVTLCQHFEHIHWALVPLQKGISNNYNYTKSHSRSVLTVLARRKCFFLPLSEFPAVLLFEQQRPKQT